MKIKKNYVLRKVANDFIVVPIGDEIEKFNGMLTLNEPAALLWNCLKEGADEEKLVLVLTANYDVSEAIARRDIQAFIKNLIDADMME